MPHHRTTNRLTLGTLVLGLLVALLSVEVAQAFTWPRIDPSGKQIFLWPNQNPNYLYQPGYVRRWHESGVQVLPTRVIAPVGAEVIMTAGVCGKDGHLTAHERVEWAIAPGSVGHFVAVGDNPGLHLLGTQTRPKKVDNSFAIGTTSSQYLRLNRGTPTPTDDVKVNRGQAWITVTSPIEGTSYVTAYAPEAYPWDKRIDTGSIYWIDAQWTFPPPRLGRSAGTPCVLSTKLIRKTTFRPLINWRVRYEVLDGPQAGFDSGLDTGPSRITEVTTNAEGEAVATLRKLDGTRGLNNVRITIIRPSTAAADELELNVATGQTAVQWNESGLTIDKQGPQQALAGQRVQYRIDVHNAGVQTARDVTVIDDLRPGLEYQHSDPPAAVTGNQVQWRLGDMIAGERKSLSVTLLAGQSGTFQNCVTARTADGLTVQSCTTTSVAPAAAAAPPIRLEVTGPAQTTVGARVTFLLNIINTSPSPTAKFVLIDRYEAGLRHPSLKENPIYRDIEPLAPGESRQITVEFDAIAPGPTCNIVEIVNDGSNALVASNRACVNVAPGGTVPPATAPTTPTPTPPITQPPTTTPTAPTPVTPEAPRPTLQIRKTGPNQRLAGEQAEFTIDITNTSTVNATQLKLTDNYDTVLRPVQATDGHAFVGNDLVWVVDQLPPNRTIRFQVVCRCDRAAPRACNRVTVSCAEGARADDEFCLAIQSVVVPLSISLTDSTDPLNVGAVGLYEIRVTNNGTDSDRNVAVGVTFPAELTPLDQGNSGPSPNTRFSVQGQTVRFEPIAEIRGKETLIYRVNARAMGAGTNVTIRAEVTSQNTPTPASADTKTTTF